MNDCPRLGSGVWESGQDGKGKEDLSNVGAFWLYLPWRDLSAQLSGALCMMDKNKLAG